MFSRWKVPMVFVLCLVSACLLTYPLWCLGQFAISELGWAGLSKYGIQKYFNRSFLLCAVLGVLWVRPRLSGGRDGLVSMEFDRTSLLRGLGLGTAAFGVLMTVGIALSCVVVNEGKALGMVAVKAALAAAVVGLLEEWLFRHYMLNAFCRRLRPFAAQTIVAAIFASVHFLKPTAPPVGLPVDLWVGFRLLPSVFHQYSDLSAILGGWMTLFALGVLLSRLSLRSGVIWPAVGVHTSIIFWNKVLSAGFSVRVCPPWFAGSFQSGLVPLLTLVVMALSAGWYIAGRGKRQRQ